MLSAQKLLLGKLAAAWRAYPHTRSELAAIPNGKSILVTGTHRSGTTWFGSMLAASGIWHIHEPFAPYKGLWKEWFSYARSDDRNTEIDRLMQQLLAGKHRQTLQIAWTDHPMMPLRILPQSVHRVLIKDPIACLMSDYLTRHFDLDTFVLFRHPAAFVESVIRLEWPQRGGIQSLLQNEQLMADYLEPFRSLMESVKDEEGLRTASVMHGCLNRVLWEFTSGNAAMHVVQFEKLCDKPIEIFHNLFLKTGLPYYESTTARHIDICFSNKEGLYRPHSVNRMSSNMAYGWKDRVSNADLNAIRLIWEKFEVPLYRNSIDWTNR